MLNFIQLQLLEVEFEKESPVIKKDLIRNHSINPSKIIYIEDTNEYPIINIKYGKRVERFFVMDKSYEELCGKKVKESNVPSYEGVIPPPPPKRNNFYKNGMCTAL